MWLKASIFKQRLWCRESNRFPKVGDTIFKTFLYKLITYETLRQDFVQVFSVILEMLS